MPMITQHVLTKLVFNLFPQSHCLPIHIGGFAQIGDDMCMSADRVISIVMSPMYSLG